MLELRKHWRLGLAIPSGIGSPEHWDTSTMTSKSKPAKKKNEHQRSLFLPLQVQTKLERTLWIRCGRIKIATSLEHWRCHWYVTAVLGRAREEAAAGIAGAPGVSNSMSAMAVMPEINYSIVPCIYQRYIHHLSYHKISRWYFGYAIFPYICIYVCV